MRHLIELNQIQKFFGSKTVLKSVSLKLQEGKFYALLGKNGAGKSTLIKVLMKCEVPDQGSGSVLGKSLDDDDASVNEEIGYVSENLNYTFSMSLSELFRSLSKLYPRWNEEEFQNIVRRLKIDPSRSYRDLSRGQKMQVSFAAAIAMQPKLILLDEVTAVLDADARAYLMDILNQFVKRGGTVVMATNIVSEVQYYADHLLLVDQGSLRLDATVSDLLAKFAKLRLKEGMSHSILQKKECIPVTLNSDRSISYLIPQSELGSDGLPAELVDRRGITLEEIFIYYTRDSV